jgi:hypothetical protein
MYDHLGLPGVLGSSKMLSVEPKAQNSRQFADVITLSFPLIPARALTTEHHAHTDG